MENLLNGLDQQSDALSSDQLRIELQDRGIDIDALLQKMDAIIAAHDKHERLAWMRVADEKKESLRIAETPGAQWSDQKPEHVLIAFARFLKAGGPERALAFKNKGTLSLQDMAAILEADERLQKRTQGKGTDST